MKKQRVVVIGNGMVGHKFIESLNESSDQVEIITFSEEPKLAYDRVQLSSYFSGKSASDLSLTSEEEYKKRGVNYSLNEKVIGLEREEKQVITQSGQTIGYDKLIIATGSTPFVPPIPTITPRFPPPPTAIGFPINSGWSNCATEA